MQALHFISKGGAVRQCCNLEQCKRPNSNHQKTIIIGQIIALRNFENYGGPSN